ncbi:MAG: hypothetical protein ACM3MK_13965 [Chitinophagales bacterium]
MTNARFAAFEVKVIVRNPHAVDMTALLEKAKSSIASLVKIRLNNLELKRYGVKFSGTAPLPDIPRIAENMYFLTFEGGMEIVIMVSKRYKYLIKEGKVYDFSDLQTAQVPIQVDDAGPSEEDLSRIGF